MNRKSYSCPALLPERNVNNDGLSGGFTTGYPPQRLWRKESVKLK